MQENWFKITCVFIQLFIFTKDSHFHQLLGAKIHNQVLPLRQNVKGLVLLIKENIFSLTLKVSFWHLKKWKWLPFLPNSEVMFPQNCSFFSFLIQNFFLKRITNLKKKQLHFSCYIYGRSLQTFSLMTDFSAGTLAFKYD